MNRTHEREVHVVTTLERLLMFVFASATLRQCHVVFANPTRISLWRDGEGASMKELQQAIPDAQALLNLQPEEVAGKLISFFGRAKNG